MGLEDLITFRRDAERRAREAERRRRKEGEHLNLTATTNEGQTVTFTVPNK